MPIKPTDQEDEYFARIEQELKRKLAEKHRMQPAGEASEKLRDLHYMKCPKCGMDLIEMDFKGMKIDECSGCRGMWLDAGEFDAMSRIEKPVMDRLFKLFRE